jgi:hypothetical protein
MAEKRRSSRIFELVAILAFMAFLAYLIYTLRKESSNLITAQDIEKAREIARSLEKWQ